MKYTSPLVFTVSAIATAILSSPATSDAGFARLSAAVCFANPGPSTADLNNVAFSLDSLENFDTADDAMLMCPTPDDANVEKELVDILDVYVTDNSTISNIAAKTCGATGGTAGRCGSFVYSSGTGAQILEPPLTYWTYLYTQDYPYVVVALPPKQTGQVPSALRGIYITD